MEANDNHDHEELDSDPEDDASVPSSDNENDASEDENGVPLPPPPPPATHAVAAAAVAPAAAPAPAPPLFAAGYMAPQQNPPTIVDEIQEVTRQQVQRQLRKMNESQRVNVSANVAEAVRDLARRVRHGRFESVQQCRELLSEVARLESQLGAVSSDVRTALGWPDSEITGLKVVVQLLDSYAVAVKDGRKCLEGKTVTLQAVENALSLLSSLRSRRFTLLRTADMHDFALPLDELRAIEADADSLEEALVRRYFALVLEQTARVPQARTKFDLKYRLTDCLRLLAAAVARAERLRHVVNLADLVAEANAAADQLRKDYAHALDPAVSGSSGGLAASPVAPPPASIGSSLHSCIRSNDVKKLEQLLAAYKASDGLAAVVNAEEPRSRQTPLAVAVEKANLAAVRLLLAAGADASWADSGGQRTSLLHVAAAAASADCLRALLAAPNIDPNAVSAHNAETPLHVACRLMHVEAMKALVRAGADLSAKNATGKTPLAEADFRCFGRLPAVRPDREPPLMNCGRYLNSRTLSDVALLVDGETFPAHRLVLCTHSDVFRALLEGGGDWKESSQRQIALNDVPAPIFALLLRYCYTGEIEIPKGDSTIGLDLLAVAQRFLINGLKRRLEILLVSKIQLENAFQLFTGAVRHECPQLQRACSSFILANYDDIAFADADFAVLFAVFDSIKPIEAAAGGSGGGSHRSGSFTGRQVSQPVFPKLD